MKKLSSLSLILLLAASHAFAGSDSLEKGEELYNQNKPLEAKPYLEGALSEDPSNEKLYLYLGMVYQQLGDTERAISILKRGLGIATSYKDLFYYNIGNNYFSRKEYTVAEQMYSNAIKSNDRLSDGYINRANARLQLQSYDGAISDYETFILMQPQDPRRPRIEALLRLLRQSIEDKEKARLAEQEAMEKARQAELEAQEKARQAELEAQEKARQAVLEAQEKAKQAELEAQEKARQAELEKQKALMNDVLGSLSNAGEDAKNATDETIKVKEQAVDVDIKD